MGNVINLAKKAKVVLEKKAIFGEKAHVVLATDISVSMSHLYNSGVVQELVDRLLGIGINMDVDRCIDVFAFGERDHEIGTATEKNHEGFVNNVMLRKVSLEYSTRYAGVMNRIVNKFGNPIKPAKQGFFAKFLGKKQPEKKTDIPTLVFFVTDGDNFDKTEAERIINESSNQAIFWQFVGIGRERFEFLQKLDDLKGRYLDNADFFSVSDLSQVSDDDLYNKLLNEFPEWIKEARAKGVLS